MSPKVLLEKSQLLAEVLTDLKKHIGSPLSKMEGCHYEIERQIQLSVDLSLSIAKRKLSIEGIAVPSTGKEVFKLLASKKMLSAKNAEILIQATGLRNLIVHEYGKIDYSLFFGSVPTAFRAFVSFLKSVQKWYL